MTHNDWIRNALSWLATYGLHSTLFLGGAWLWCTLRAPRVNRSKERVWKLALVGGVLSTTLQLALGGQPLLGQIDWLAAEPLAEAAASQPSSGASSLPEQRTAELPAPASIATDSSAPSTVPALELARAEPASPAPEARVKSAARRPRTDERDANSRPENGGAHPALDAPPPALVSAAPDLEACADPVDAPAVTPVTSTVAELGRALREKVAQGRAHAPRLVLFGWVAIGSLGVLGLLASWTCLRRRMLSRRELRAGALVEMLTTLQQRAGLKRRVRLSVSARITSPFSTGLLWPEICVPQAVLHALTPAQQQALLAHELGHLLRHDPAWFGVGFLIEKLFFFQPLNRLARRELAELAELACDDWAVRWTGARLALASCLTEVAGWIVDDKPRLVMPPGLAGQRSRLAQRVERLLDDRRSPHGEPPAPWWPALAAGSLTLAALAVPGVSATPVSAPRSVPEVLPAVPATAREELELPPRYPSMTRLPSVESTAGHAARAASDAHAATLPAPFAIELGAELRELEAEIAALRAELQDRALDERFSASLQRIEARMQELRAQHQRAHELLTRLAARNTPALAPAAAPTPTSNR
ncbi:MAG: hypothetical protein EXS08_13420 [Planctomycetes bacterium]|nr:hypothetical protein [Planctomycetota bacterium]